MIYVCICENSIMASRKYREMLMKISRKHNLEINIKSFQSGEALLHVVNKYMIDIIYMDIYLEGMNGIETARMLQSIGYQTSLIFLTNSQKHVYEAFDVRPVNYLIKGRTSQEEFERVFLRAVELSMQRRREFLLCKFDNNNTTVPIKDIGCIRFSKRLITVYYKDKEAQFPGNRDMLVKQLQEDVFLRIHRFYMVNLLHITAFCSHQVVLENGKELPVGVTYVNDLRQAFSELYGKTAVKL